MTLSTAGPRHLLFFALGCAALTATSSAAQVPVTPLPPVVVTGKTYSRGDTNATWRLSARQAALDSLAAGRQRWEVKRPASYRISAGILCGFCSDGSSPARPPGTYPVARVRGRELFATGTFQQTEKINGGIWLEVPVESLFRLLEKTANDTARKITELKLDPVYGFPRSWSTDGAHNGEGGMMVTDQDDWGRVVLFTPDQPPRACGWLQRILRNCAAPYPPLGGEVRSRIGVEHMAVPAASRLLPLFPPELLLAGESGIVRVSYAIDVSGHIMQYSGDITQSTNGWFMSAVFGAMEQWAFTPARAEGRHVASRYEEVFEFRAPPSTSGRQPIDTLISSLVTIIPYAAHDTTPDGVPRTIIGFRPRGSDPLPELSTNELLAAKRAALSQLASVDAQSGRR